MLVSMGVQCELPLAPVSEIDREPVSSHDPVLCARRLMRLHSLTGAPAAALSSARPGCTLVWGKPTPGAGSSGSLAHWASTGTSEAPFLGCLNPRARTALFSSGSAVRLEGPDSHLPISLAASPWEADPSRCVPDRPVMSLPVHRREVRLNESEPNGPGGSSRRGFWGY